MSVLAEGRGDRGALQIAPVETTPGLAGRSYGVPHRCKSAGPRERIIHAQAARMRQRGFGLLVYLIAAAAVLGALYLVIQFIDSTWATSAGVEKGAAETTAKYAERDNAALHKAIADKEKAEARVAKLEAEASQKVTAADADYQRGIRDGKAKLDTAVARVHAGYRLRDPGGTAGAAAKPAGSPGPAAGDPGKRDGEARAELPRAAGCDLSERTSEALYRLAGDADDTVKQLSACQAVARSLYEFALKLSDTLSGRPP